MGDLPDRRVADALLMLCGATNIVLTHRRSADVSDPFGFADRIGEMNVGLILNPIHDYLTRYEIRNKRRHHSLNGRTVISVWNMGKPERTGKGGEAHIPSTVFHDGHERTDAVREVRRPFADRPDIRIGVFDSASTQGEWLVRSQGWSVGVAAAGGLRAAADGRVSVAKKCVPGVSGAIPVELGPRTPPPPSPQPSSICERHRLAGFGTRSSPCP